MSDLTARTVTDDTSYVNNIDALFNALDTIEAEPGKLLKSEMLQKIKGDKRLDPLAQEFFSIGYDWYRIFNVGAKSLEEPKKKGKKKSEPEVEEPKPPFDIDPWEHFKLTISKLEYGRTRISKEDLRKRMAFHNDNPLHKKWFTRALLKDLSMGVSEKTINKCWPGLINYFEVQLADSLEDPSELKYPCYLEPKIDGIRAVCRVDAKRQKVSFLSRGGQVLNNTEPAGINAFLLKFVNEDTVFDGELFGTNWNDTTRVTSKGEGEADPELVANLRFYVFDAMPAADWDAQKCDLTYEQRRKEIKFTPMNSEINLSHILVQKTASHKVESFAEITRIYNSYLLQKMEGVMLKDPNGLYTFKRSKTWLKHKPVETHDYPVLGAEEGEGKHKGRMGVLVLDLGDGKTCKVGSGFNDAEREEFWKMPPVGRFVEVKFKEKTPDGLLREPIFLHLRMDKGKA